MVEESGNTFVIKERITRRVLRPLMENFSNTAEAIHELVDNAFDEFDEFHGGKELQINISLKKHTVIIENIGGKGMGPNELESWLTWGEAHKKDQIGEYGQGGKAAMGYLGTGWFIRSRRWNQDFVCELNEDRWDDTGCSEKEIIVNKVPLDTINVPESHGYCYIEIRNLRKRRINAEQLKNTLSNVYRALLVDGKAVIKINNELVSPVTIPEYSGFEREGIKEKTSTGWLMKGWVGRLKRDTRVGKGLYIPGGIRLLRRGRLICDGEYFGHRDYRFKASLGNLIGEVDLIKVPVLPNKTDFQRDTTEWQEIELRMRDILKPHIENLLKQAEEEVITREEKKRLNETRNFMIEALKVLKDEGEDGKQGNSQGRKSASENKGEKDLEPQTDIEQIEKSPIREPRTPPPENAVGRLKRLGTSSMPRWELRFLEPDIRSVWEDKDDGRCLIINTNYCLYNKRDGDHFYLAETAAMQLPVRDPNEKLSVQDYLNDVNRLLLAFNQVHGKNN